jgi:two-component system, OmpR family, KDP operon response regulator KdpE
VTAAPPPRILIVDDEAPIRRFLRIALEAHGYAVSEAETARRGLEAAALEGPDLIILDLGLPDQDGKAALAELRSWSETPVIVLSVRESEAEKVAALEAGAQDYVVKPFGVQELLARIRSQLRARPGTEAREAVRRVGDLEIDAGARQVTVAGESVKLTRKEFDVLWTLARNAGRLVTHRALLAEVWGKAHEHDTQYLRVFVRQLRQKLGEDAAHPRYIINEPGVGYRIGGDGVD